MAGPLFPEIGEAQDLVILLVLSQLSQSPIREAVPGNFQSAARDAAAISGAREGMHRSTGDVVLKSNSMGSLPVVGNTAVITGKATLNGVGNYGFRATVLDNGDAGTTDQFSLKVTNPAGALVTDLTYDALTLDGGNIQVPWQGAKK